MAKPEDFHAAKHLFLSFFFSLSFLFFRSLSLSLFYNAIQIIQWGQGLTRVRDGVIGLVTVDNRAQVGTPEKGSRSLIAAFLRDTLSKTNIGGRKGGNDVVKRDSKLIFEAIKYFRRANFT